MLICSVTNTHEHSHTIIPTETHPSFGEPKILHRHASFPSFCFRKHHVKTVKTEQPMQRRVVSSVARKPNNRVSIYPPVADHFRQNNKQQPNQSIEKIAPPVSVLILSNTKKREVDQSS